MGCGGESAEVRCMGGGGESAVVVVRCRGCGGDSAVVVMR